MAGALSDVECECADVTPRHNQSINLRAITTNSGNIDTATRLTLPLQGQAGHDRRTSFGSWKEMLNFFEKLWPT